MRIEHPELKTWKTEQEIARQIERIAKEIESDFKGTELQLMGVLRGGFIFMGDLVRKLQIPVTCHFINIYYKDILIGENHVKEIEEAVIFPTSDMTGKQVLLLGDVVDTGIIIDHIRNLVKMRGAESVKIAVVLDKKPMRRIDVHVDYSLFEDLEAGYVVGYGLDFNEKYRQIPYLAHLKG